MRTVLSFALAVVWGCASEPATQIVVVIDSDLSVPDELDEVRIRVLSASGELATDRVVRLGTGEGQFLLPADFGVAPRDADAPERVTIELSPMLEGATLFVVHAVVAFRVDHRLRLDMALPRRCLTDAAECEAAQTCGTEGCTPAMIDAASLPEFEP